MLKIIIKENFDINYLQLRPTSLAFIFFNNDEQDVKKLDRQTHGKLIPTRPVFYTNSLNSSNGALPTQQRYQYGGNQRQMLTCTSTIGDLKLYELNAVQFRTGNDCLLFYNKMAVLSPPQTAISTQPEGNSCEETLPSDARVQSCSV
ncbi:hypothetical protein RRG08_029001 [Elysia crispata]|uniref:Uncharacterized protein n=1 Tax=Elysia crispata TaxID=231223 RepID=A0AAE1BB58_9GAST|nr:hypothetical protein RRG08_029001 [Elysia crispata]